MDAVTGASKNIYSEPLKYRIDGFKGNFLRGIASGGKRREAHGKLGDLYRYYAGDPLMHNVLFPSKYKPTNSKNPNASYISIQDPTFINTVLENANRVFIDKNFNTEGRKDNIINDSTVSINGYEANNNTSAIGRFFISKGNDDIGDYISYYDVFDSKQPGESELGEKLGAVKSFEIYDRIYVDKDSSGKYVQKKQKGGKIKEGLEKGQSKFLPDFVMPSKYPSARDFSKEYAKSPKYKERLQSSGYKDVPGEIQKRYDKVKTADIYRENNPNLHSRYDPTQNKIIIGGWEHKNLGATFDEVESHETGHNLIDSKDLNKYDTDNLSSRMKKPDSVEEAKADMDSLRYILMLQGIYNAGTEDFTKEHLDKLGDYFVKRRLLQKYSEEDLIWLMNNIAYNTEENKNVAFAKNGGKLLYFSDVQNYI